jgi:hypothetical protein
MPWRVQRLLYLMGCAFGAIGLGIVVLVRDDSFDTNLLALIAILGGIAIIVTTILPSNGSSDS